jgi:hypothetical protein
MCITELSLGRGDIPYKKYDIYMKGKEAKIKFLREFSFFEI